MRRAGASLTTAHTTAAAAQISSELGHDMRSIVKGIGNKLGLRHPHHQATTKDSGGGA